MNQASPSQPSQTHSWLRFNDFSKGVALLGAGVTGRYLADSEDVFETITLVAVVAIGLLLVSQMASLATGKIVSKVQSRSIKLKLERYGVKARRKLFCRRNIS